MSWKVGVAGAVALLCAGCNTSSQDGGLSVVKLTDGGRQVVELKAGDGQLAACRKLGEVKAYPPYVLPDDGRFNLRNAVAQQGGNVMVVTNYFIAPATADAYRCG
ncbi:hypothetical protein [Chelatococcus reniformis]|uniref:Uncharacterized protein n=1 Tax=Chelatococcus reniformis TaxID=1494448 RepID=A0A916TZY5_9HYPH|nr:hypothetical protein [Chelatococcus reniformis]GGC49873.1 hypothetical protein GCM10010994_06270 [Chelatococcus reniformis]